MRVMGIDYGDVRIGVALSDPLGITAQAYAVLDVRKTRDIMRELATIAATHDVGRVVVGYPRNMNGTVGERARRAEEFAETVKAATSLPVTLFDERLTTVSAQRALIAGRVRREKRRDVVDKIAAALILQTYLDSGGRP